MYHYQSLTQLNCDTLANLTTNDCLNDLLATTFRIASFSTSVTMSVVSETQATRTHLSLVHDMSTEISPFTFNSVLLLVCKDNDRKLVNLAMFRQNRHLLKHSDPFMINPMSKFLKFKPNLNIVDITSLPLKAKLSDTSLRLFVNIRRKSVLDTWNSVICSSWWKSLFCSRLHKPIIIKRLQINQLCEFFVPAVGGKVLNRGLVNLVPCPWIDIICFVVD